MSDLQALILGIVQGLTEFLPIPSSGHLIVVPWIGDFTFLRDHEAFDKTFDVALHQIIRGTIGLTGSGARDATF